MEKGRKGVVVGSSLLILFLTAIVVVSFAKNPPTVVKPHDHEAEQAGQQSEQSSSLLEATLDEIDSKNAGTLSLVVEGNSNEVAAKKLLDSIHGQFEGLLGKVSTDLSNQTFTIEYDKTKLTEEKLLEAIIAAGFKAGKTPSK